MTPKEFHSLFLKVTNSKSGWIWAHGLCFQYTFCFLSLVGGKGKSYLTKNPNSKAYGHCFIEFQGLYYDSENPTGVSKWKHLQRYMNKAQDKKITHHRTIGGIQKLWFQEKDLVACQEIIRKINLVSQKEKLFTIEHYSQ